MTPIFKRIVSFFHNFPSNQNKDLKAEEQMISALPDVKRVTITADDEFMILACDGIWNSLSSEQVVKFVRTRILDGQTKMSTICEEVR